MLLVHKTGLVTLGSPVRGLIWFSGSATDCSNLSFFPALSALSLATSSTQSKLLWRIEPSAASDSDFLDCE